MPDAFSNQVPRENIEENNIQYMEGNIEELRGDPWQIVKSIGEGAVAALSVFKFLIGQQMRNLGWALQDEWQD